MSEVRWALLGVRRGPWTSASTDGRESSSVPGHRHLQQPWVRLHMAAARARPHRASSHRQEDLAKRRWLHRADTSQMRFGTRNNGAGDEGRTRRVCLGKAVPHHRGDTRIVSAFAAALPHGGYAASFAGWAIADEPSALRGRLCGACVLPLRALRPGAGEEDRTPDLVLTEDVLLPSELRRHGANSEI